MRPPRKVKWRGLYVTPEQKRVLKAERDRRPPRSVVDLTLEERNGLVFVKAYYRSTDEGLVIAPDGSTRRGRGKKEGTE